MHKGNEMSLEERGRIFFLSVRTMNKLLAKEMGSLEAEVESRMGKYMEAEDNSDRQTQSVKEAIQDARETYDLLTAPTNSKNFFIRIARKVPLPPILSAIKTRRIALENIFLVKLDIERSTAKREKYIDVSNYAFRTEEPFLRSSGIASTSSEPWSVEFNLLATANSRMTWVTSLEYSEAQFQTWWMEKRPSKCHGADAWADLKTLCKCVVYVFDDLTSEYLERFPSVGRLSNIADKARIVAVELVRLHAKHPDQDYGISMLFGLTVPIVFSLWKTTEKAKGVYNDSATIQNLASDILSTALVELENLMEDIQRLVSAFGGVLLADPYLIAAKEDKAQSSYVPKPAVSQLFDIDPKDFSAKARALVLDSRLLECESDLDYACSDIQKMESTKAAEIIATNCDEADFEFDFEGLKQSGLKKIDVQPKPLKILGSGAFSVVSARNSKDGSELYAVKSYKKKTSAIGNLVKRESSIWVNLKHDNVLPLLGYCILPQDTFPSLVTPACLDKNLERFLKEHPSSSEKKKLSFLHDVASGIQHLHSEDVAHGDLRAANILVQRLESGETRAVLCDFGISDITIEVKERLYQQSAEQRTCDNWLAPELLFAHESIVVRVSKEGDMYAFGCVILEVMFGKKPYALYHLNTVRDIKLAGGLPAKRADVNDKFWPIVEECWKYERNQRATSSWVLSKLGNLLYHSDF